MQVLKDDIRDKLLKAAADEFYVKGYKGASIRDIAKLAGVSLSNTYNYFLSKSELFAEVVSPMRNNISELFNDFITPEISTESAFNSYVSHLTERLSRLSQDHCKTIIIFLEKSEGTEFENTKDQISDMLEMHFTTELGDDDGRVYRLIASGFISCILAVMKEDNNLVLKNSLEKYLKYHVSGIRALKALE